MNTQTQRHRIHRLLTFLTCSIVLLSLSPPPASAEDSIPRYAEKQGFDFDSVKNEEKSQWELFIKKN